MKKSIEKFLKLQVFGTYQGSIYRPNGEEIESFSVGNVPNVDAFFVVGASPLLAADVAECYFNHKKNYNRAPKIFIVSDALSTYDRVNEADRLMAAHFANTLAYLGVETLDADDFLDIKELYVRDIIKLIIALRLPEKKRKIAVFGDAGTTMFLAQEIGFGLDERHKFYVYETPVMSISEVEVLYDKGWVDKVWFDKVLMSCHLSTNVDLWGKDRLPMPDKMVVFDGEMRFVETPECIGNLDAVWKRYKRNHASKKHCEFVENQRSMIYDLLNEIHEDWSKRGVLLTAERLFDEVTQLALRAGQALEKIKT